ncbi:MAG TPA: transglycosylase SLT domain-containing protein [Longimicrobiales bacterium]|nr:transglycosylase SLT domain-containing protein [Longimicrobiales bacterium]
MPSPTPRGARPLLLSLLLAGACAPAAPARGPAPLATPELAFRPALEPARPERPEIEARIDEILASPVLRDPEFAEAVQGWVEYWREDVASAMPAFLERMAVFQALVDSALVEHDLPPSLCYLPFIESGYNPLALSRASAVGMWQFMRTTATGLGMEVTPLLDQRRDPVRSTEAAIRYLSSLRTELGSWFLALAAYNGGPNRVRRVLARYAPGVEPSDSLFWALRHHFPRETRDFVPKLIGAALVAGDPAAHGFEAPAADRFAFDVVRVPDATTLDVVARAAGTSLEEIERLNPEYVKGITPAGRTSVLRVPEGRGPAFTAAYALIPPDERVTFVEHRVAPGETLSHIARRYGVRVADIQAANPRVRPRYLRIGASIVVPIAPRADRALQAGG